MNEQEKFNRDKANVMAMIRFLLIAGISFGVIYFSTKLFLILIPFIIGFLLAKTSYIIAGPLSKIGKANTPKGLTQEDFDAIKKSRDKKKNIWKKIFQPNDPKPKKPLRTKLAILIYIILLIGIAIFCVWGINQLLYQANNAINSATEFAQSIQDDNYNLTFLDKMSNENGGFIPPTIIEILKDNILATGNKIVDSVPDILTKVVSFTWNLAGDIPYAIFVVICVILSGYYFISDGPTVMKSYLRNTPNKIFRRKSVELINDLSVTLFRVLGGYLSLLIITAVESFILFEIAGIDYAVILSLITGIIDFLPVLGISATMIPVMIYCAINNNITSVIILIIGMALMTVIRRIIEPIILGKSMRIHPLLMLISMIFGVYVWGPIGFLVGPMMLIIVIQIIKVFELDKKFLAFMSRVLKKFVAEPEDTNQQ